MRTKLRSYAIKVFLSAAGLFLLAVAMALLSASRLGMTPVQSLTYVLYSRFGDWISFGTLCFLWNMLLLLMQLILLRRRFRVRDLLQIPLSLFFGSAVDVAKWMLAFLAPQTFLVRIAVLLFGIFVLAFGIFLTVKADFVMNSGEAAVRALCVVSGKPFGSVKTVFDLTVVAGAVVCSFLLFGSWRLDIVGVATLACSLLTGVLVKFFTKLWKGAL